MPAFLHGYRYPVSALPIVVTKAVIREHFEPLCRLLPSVLQRALVSYFKEDAAAFEAYFSHPRLLYTLLRAYPVDTRDLMIRFDLSLNDGGVTVFEINCGSSLGGCGLDWLAPQALQLCESTMELPAGRVEFRRVFDGLLAHLIQSIRRYKRGSPTGNIAIHDFSEGNGESLRSALQQILDRVRPAGYPPGRVYLFSAFSELEFDNGDGAWLDGAKLDAVVPAFPPADTLMPLEAVQRLTTAYLKGHIVCPDTPLHGIFGDKRLFAIAHNCVSRNLLSPEDSQLIERWIPWTALVRRSESAGSPRRSLPTYLVVHKDDFVLKRAVSYGGQDVIIGRSVDGAEWRCAIQRALDDDDWVAQRYRPIGTVEALARDGNVCPHEAIWGVFSFGDSYCGAFVRARVADGHSPVINSANGAVEYIVVEDSGPARSCS